MCYHLEAGECRERRCPVLSGSPIGERTSGLGTVRTGVGEIHQGRFVVGLEGRMKMYREQRYVYWITRVSGHSGGCWRSWAVSGGRSALGDLRLMHTKG